jgi:hypothetical protein
MNSETLSNTTGSAIKAISGVTDLHEKSFLEVVDSINGGDNIEFYPPISNIIFKPAEFN